MAEKEGFEPSRRLSQPTPLAGEPLRPLGYFSKPKFNAGISYHIGLKMSTIDFVFPRKTKSSRRSQPAEDIRRPFDLPLRRKR